MTIPENMIMLTRNKKSLHWNSKFLTAYSTFYLWQPKTKRTKIC